jgi:predicted permease
MLESLLLVAGQVLTLFLLMGIGFLLARIGKLTEKAVSELSFLVLYIVIPSAIIQSFQVERTAELIRTLLMGGGDGRVLRHPHRRGAVVLPEAALDIRGPMRFSQVYCNTGFMGLPLLSAILGEEALIFGGLAIVMFNLFQWTTACASWGAGSR